jgi:DNA-binding response OmpR family regulator
MPKVFIVDDDPDARKIMNVVMRQHGYEVETAFSKEDALSRLQDFQPSVILLDVLLSGTDGREFCREIKINEKMKNVPVIMVSAHPGAAENISSYGADDFISKPIDTAALLEKMERLLNNVK